MNPTDVTWGIALKFWWAYTWRALLLCVLGGAVLGFIIGFVAAVAKLDQNAAKTYAALSGVLISIPVSVWMMKIVLGKFAARHFPPQSDISPR